MSTGRWLRQISTIAWIKPSWKFTVYDVNSYLFAYTVVITIHPDQIECSAKLKTKNDLGVYNISDKNVALLDYVGMSTSYTYLAYNIHGLFAVSYHFNIVARLKFQSTIKLLVQLVIYIQGHCINLCTSILFATCISTPSISIFEKI